uniref:Uncharacterized protein LOC104218800 n=1 Tax=Nicotiana sylvestris TaxID=4096 RepID=A0A1U7VMU2_NICSY|nr:PREDICTED: uncharacterized protein LOC104218800 [Nicotiana sylvestris]
MTTNYIPLFISLAASHNWPLNQLDIKDALCHGDLLEEMYMEQPPVSTVTVGTILLVVYVDNIVNKEDGFTGISSPKLFLYAKFHTKDLGQLKYFLGVEVTISKKGILSQQIDEIQLLHRLLAKLDSANVTTSNYVQLGIAFVAHLNSWIVDSSANRYMTGSSKGIQNYSPCLKGDNVKIANGSLTPISGKGSVVCTPNIKLSSCAPCP